MKLLFVSDTGNYFPFVRGGGARVNRNTLEQLASRGHSVTAVFPIFSNLRGEASLIDEPVSDDKLGGVSIRAVRDVPAFADEIRAVQSALRPDATLVANVFSPAILDAVVAGEAPTVALLHDIYGLPFGPACDSNRAAYRRSFRKLDRLIAVSHYIGNYLREWGHMTAQVLYPLGFARGRPPDLGRFDREFVTLINASGIKGLPILLQLARQFPEVRFAAVPGWATSDVERKRLSELGNVTPLPPTDDIDEIFRQTKVLLVPSLAQEGFPLVITEALLRGIPVLASDVGGVRETPIDPAFVLPVAAITSYANFADASLFPAQPIEPWIEALAALLGDQHHYEATSQAARDASWRFVRRLTIEPYEQVLLDVIAAAPRD